MKSTSKYALFAITLLAIFLTSCNSCNNKAESKKFKIGYLPKVVSLPHFIAKEKGFYKEEGLEIEDAVIKTSNQMSQDLIGGHIDASIHLALVPLLKQMEKAPNSAKIFSISAMDAANHFDGVLVKSNSTITKLEELSGKKVGVFPGTTAKNSFADVFKRKFPNLPLPIFVELDPPLHIQSLERGDVDGLFAYEPTLTLGIIKNNFREIFRSIYVEQYTPNPIGIGAVNAKWLNDNPKTAAAFFRTMDKAVVFMNQHPDEARQILSRATNLDMNVAQVMHILPMSLSTEINYENLNGYFSVLKTLGEITTVPNAEDVCIKPIIK